MSHEYIVRGMRQKLAPYLKYGTDQDENAGHTAHFITGTQEYNSRFVRKIPRKNYEDLPKLVPINWL